MSPSNRRVRALLILAAVTGLSSATPAFGQSTAPPPAGNATQAAPMSTQPEASTTTPAQQRAAKKAARKANRAQKNAELDKLEKNGYSPSAHQSNYPDNIQNAEKKANGQ
jgi:hypothetical protein